MISGSNLRKATFKRRFGVNLEHVNKMLQNVTGWNKYKNTVRNQLNRFKQNENVNNVTFKKNIANLNRIYKRQLDQPRIPPPPPLPPRRPSSGSVLLQKSLNRNQLAKAASVESGIPVSVLKQNTKAQNARLVMGYPSINSANEALRKKGVPNSVIRTLSPNNKMKYAQARYRFRRGIFGGYRFEEYNPELNVRRTGAYTIRSGLSKTRNIPLRFSSGFASFKKGIGRRLIEGGVKNKTMAESRLNESKAKRENLRRMYFG